MLATALSAFAMIIWWFGAGPFLIFFNAVAHSGVNADIKHYKSEGRNTFWLRVNQVLHCIGYAVWVGVLIAIPVLFKIYFK